MFVNNPHQHPLIFLRGIEFVTLQSLLNFIYLGQTEVKKRDLQEFLAAAKELQINGIVKDLSMLM